MNVLAQLEVTINQGEYTVTDVVLIQKDAPSPLLLGTDKLPSLGFSFIFVKIGEISSNTDALEKHNAKGDTEMRDSVTQTNDICDDGSQAQQMEITPVIESEAIRELCLAQASWIPSQCRKVVKAALSTPAESCLPQSLDTLLFTPSWLQEGMVMTDTYK